MTMKTKNWVTVLLINLVVALLIVSPFLPGPSNGIVHLFYSAGQILGILGFVIIPLGIILVIKELRRRRKDNHYHVDIKAIILLTLSLTISLTSIYISKLTRDFSRDFTINRADDLIQSIEKFKAEKGQYPDSLTDLIPEFITNVPSPFIMGIDKYYYERQADTYTISFQQNVILSFNVEVVTFDPTDNHQAEGELTDIYDTGKGHWRYYVYD